MPVRFGRLPWAWMGALVLGEQGATFDELLQEAVAFDPREVTTLASGTLERFGYGELLEQGIKGTHDFPIASLDEFYALAPVRLTWLVPLRVENARYLADQVLRITVLLPSLPAINGRLETPLGEHRMERLRIEGDDLRLAVDEPVRVCLSFHEVLIAAAATDGGALASGRG